MVNQAYLPVKCRGELQCSAQCKCSGLEVPDHKPPQIPLIPPRWGGGRGGGWAGFPPSKFPLAAIKSSLKRKIVFSWRTQCRVAGFGLCRLGVSQRSQRIRFFNVCFCLCCLCGFHQFKDCLNIWACKRNTLLFQSANVCESHWVTGLPQSWTA